MLSWCRRPSRPAIAKTPKASITCERGAPPTTPQRPAQTTPYQTRMDAVVQFVTTLPAVKSLLAVTHHDYLPNEYEPIQVDVDIWFHLQELKVKEGALEIVKFVLLSYEHDVQHLQTFLETCTADYERRLANKLGTHRYFFDQVVQTKVRGTQNPLPTTHLVFSKAKFTTNRAKNTCATRCEVFFNKYCSVFVETNVTAVWTALFFFRAYYYATNYFTFFDASTWDGIFNGSDKNVTNRCVTATCATEHFDNENFTCTTVVGNTKSRLLLNHFARSKTSMTRQRFCLDKGRISMTRTRSPILTSLVSSCA
jgi:hypothetical protein